MTGYDWFIVLFAIPGMVCVGLGLLILMFMVARDMWEYFWYDRR